MLAVILLVCQLAVADVPDEFGRLKYKIEQVIKQKSSTVGVLVTDAASGKSVGINHTRLWYFASAVKVPIAMEVLRQIEEKRILFDTKIKLKGSDRRDGSGEVSFLKLGSELKARYLLEQMLIESDNAATDMLLGLVGIENVNATLSRELVKDFKPITSILDVRRYAYAEMHPLALQLDGEHFIKIKAAKSYARRVQEFSKITKTPERFLKSKSVEDAFESYYKSGLNSGTLESYSELLIKLYKKNLVSPFVSSELYKLMARCRTGKKRIKKNLPPDAVFAHKTGTQVGRACDMGLLTLANGRTFAVTVCSEKWRSLAAGEKDLSEIGKAIAETF